MVRMRRRTRDTPTQAPPPPARAARADGGGGAVGGAATRPALRRGAEVVAPLHLPRQHDAGLPHGHQGLPHPAEGPHTLPNSEPHHMHRCLAPQVEMRLRGDARWCFGCGQAPWIDVTPSPPLPSNAGQEK